MVLTRVAAAVINRSSTTATKAETVRADERGNEEEKGSLDGVMAASEGATK